MAKQKVERKAIPALVSPFLADMRFPSTTEGAIARAATLVKFRESKAKYRAAARAALNEGKPVPEMPKSSFPDPNKGMMTRASYSKLVAEYNAALDDGKTPPDFPEKYCPIWVELLREARYTILRKGRTSQFAKINSKDEIIGYTPPQDWDEKKFGPWFEMDADGEATIPSGFGFMTEKVRQCHPKDVTKYIPTAEDDLLTIGSIRYLVGTGTQTGSAAFLWQPYKRGNYQSVYNSVREFVFAKAKGLANLVFRIEDKPTDGEAVRMVTHKDGPSVFYMPGQLGTAGYLERDGKQLIPAQIRKLTEHKGVKFVKLADPIAGRATWKECWPLIQKADGAAGREAMKQRPSALDKNPPQTKSITNLHVISRVSGSTDSVPFGNRLACIHMPIFFMDEDELSVGMVIGERSNYDYLVTKRESSGETEPEPVETPTAESVEPAGEVAEVDVDQGEVMEDETAEAIAVAESDD